MDYFLNLKTVFENETERTVENLQRVYSDKDYLLKSINEILEPFLSDEVINDKRILMKPNWVVHNSKETDEICMRTHDNLLLAVLELLLRKNPSQILIGDAPIQGCFWDRTIRESFKNTISALSQKYQIPVIIKDFRRVTFDPKSNNLVQERNPISDYVIFDLGTNSYLEPISYDKRKLFRVTDYDPDRLAESHGPGVHKYCVTKELFENDIIFTLPKVKTHQKTGITNALKILVGVNGDKDYLPHHRRGGVNSGGDCYPGNNLLRIWSEIVLDHANRNRGKEQYKFWRYIASKLWRLSFPSPEHSLEAAWYGNNTTWRMVLDLNKIAEYGTRNGTIESTRQRKIFSLSDGIIGGQGNGPLRPEPLPLGILSFSNHSAFTDITMASLMGFDPNKIPLIRAAMENSKYDDLKIFLNSKHVELEYLKKLAIKTNPPPGWVKYLAE